VRRGICAALFSLFAIAVVSCGGGGGGGGSAGSSGSSLPVVSPTTTPGATSPDSALAQTVLIDPTNPTLTLPAVGGVTGSLSLFGSISSGTNATVTTAFAPPTGVAAASAASVYTWLDLSSDVVLSQQPLFTFNLPDSLLSSARRTGLSTTIFALQFFDPQNPRAGYQNAGSCETLGTSVICTGIVLQVTLRAGNTYVFALVAISVGTSPGTTSTPGPGTVIASPSALSLLALGLTTTFTASETGYSGQFSAVSTNPAVATVSSAAGRTFTVTAIGAGFTALVVSDSTGRSTSIPVVVTVTSVPVN
jgi:hypothetical protein